MKAEDLVRQLIAVAPQYTNKISEKIATGSLSCSGTTVTGTTALPHPFTINQYISVIDALTPNPILSITREIDVSSITRSGNVAILTTSTPHYLYKNIPISSIVHGADQTEYNVTGFFEVVSNSQLKYLVNGVPASPATGTIKIKFQNYAYAETENPNDLTEKFTNGIRDENATTDIDGANQTEYNGKMQIVAVISPTKFIFQFEGNPTTPATGNIYLREYNPYKGYNGRYKITSIPDETSFTYEIENEIEYPAQGVPMISFNERISRAIPLDRAEQAYTPQMSDSDYWVFVAMQPCDVSRMRETQTDTLARISSGDEFRQLIIDKFSVYVFVRAVNFINAAAIRDDMNDFRYALFKSLIKFIPPTAPLKTPGFDYIIFAGDDYYQYNTSYYVHEFRFETSSHISGCDGVDKRDSSAFRYIHVDYSRDLGNNGNIIDAQSGNKLDAEDEDN